MKIYISAVAGFMFLAAWYLSDIALSLAGKI